MSGPVGWGFFAIYHNALVPVFHRCLSKIRNVLKRLANIFLQTNTSIAVGHLCLEILNPQMQASPPILFSICKKTDPYPDNPVLYCLYPSEHHFCISFYYLFPSKFLAYTHTK